MLENTWAYVVETNKQLSYQPVVEFAYYPVLGSFNNWNTIWFTNKIAILKDFDTVHKVVMYGISDNMASLIQLEKFGAINALYPTTMGYYVIKFLSEPYTLQEDHTKYGQLIKVA